MSGKELIICFSLTKARLLNCVLNLTAVRRLELLHSWLTSFLEYQYHWMSVHVLCFFNNDILYMVDQITLWYWQNCESLMMSPNWSTLLLVTDISLSQHYEWLNLIILNILIRQVTFLDANNIIFTLEKRSAPWKKKTSKYCKDDSPLLQKYAQVFVVENHLL